MHILLQRLFLIATFTISCFASPATLKKAQIKAYREIELYLAKATPQDQANLAEYLKYYRSEGHYQAVTPVPGALRESLSADAHDLFKKLTKHAQPFIHKPKSIPGSSRLTAQGEAYYQSLISFIGKKLKKSETNINNKG